MPRRPSAPCGRRRSWPRPDCRAACCRWSPVAAPSSHAAHRRRRLSHVHGLDGDRQDRRGAGRGAAQGLFDGARRQEPAARAARRPARGDGARRRAPASAPTAVSSASPSSASTCTPTSTTSSCPGSPRRCATCASAPGSTLAPTWGSLASADQFEKVGAHVGDAVAEAPKCWPAAAPGPISALTSTNRPLLAGCHRADGPVPRGDVRPRRRGLPLRLGRRDGRGAPTTRATA